MDMKLIFLFVCYFAVKSQCRRPIVINEGGRFYLVLRGENHISNSASDTAKEICELNQYKTVIYCGDEIRVYFNESHAWKQLDSDALQAPRPINDMWKNGPEKIDAAYTRSPDFNVFLFRGQQYWAFYNVGIPRLMTGYPKPFTDLGFPSHVQKIDAVINWKRSRTSANKWTTFFVGSEIYSYNEKTGKMHEGNPRRAEYWNNDLGVVTKAMIHPHVYKKSILFVEDKAIVIKNNIQKNEKRTPDQEINC